MHDGDLTCSVDGREGGTLVLFHSKHWAPGQIQVIRDDSEQCPPSPGNSVSGESEEILNKKPLLLPLPCCMCPPHAALGDSHPDCQRLTATT